jgi:selenocysteine-specific elongation factor
VPVVAARGDRVVLRAETTVGGGLVLDPSPPRRLEPERLELLARGDPVEIIQMLVREPVTIRELQATALLKPAELAAGLATLQQVGDWTYSRTWLEGVRALIRDRLAERARTNPLDPGVPLAELLPHEPWAPALVRLLQVERRDGKAYLPGAAPSVGERGGDAARLEAELAANDLVRVDDRELAAYLESEGKLRRVGDGFAVSAELYDRGRAALATLSPITLARFRDALGVSRRTAQLLLERFDGDGLTRRVGDERVLRRSRA